MPDARTDPTEPSAADAAPQGESPHDHAVVVVGGGPAGCAAAVFTARYGLDTVVFDRGRSSLRQCAYLENYLGFPGGVGVETAYELFHDHVERAGAELVADRVTAVERCADGAVEADGPTGDDGAAGTDGRSETESVCDAVRGNEADEATGTESVCDGESAADRDGPTGGFRVELESGDAVVAERVIAATRYGGEYLRPVVGDDAFETQTHDGETHTQFDRSYAAHDGTTPVDGLYVASPSAESDRQALVAAGRGARVGLRLLEAHRRDLGFFDGVAAHYDWLRRAASLDEEWAERDRWREWAETNRPDDHDVADERWREVRDREIDRRMATYVDAEEIASRRDRGRDALLDGLEEERLLDHLDDERMRAYLDEH
ncbi:FAD-dependent oxidoreductase [Halobaculum sp. MBLA0147]|uniref:FAD-dependent oxidoreductase n=1 Tax=Halobaculum sp. MBLA0147 TaxID=3079934 RepID=UPI003525349E